MDLDTSSLWSWTVPLWGLFILVLFLGGVTTAPVVLESLTGGGLTGGLRRRGKMRLEL
jgi:hypothetical protein